MTDTKDKVTKSHASSLLFSVPDDCLVSVSHFLPFRTIAMLARCCSSLNSLVSLKLQHGDASAALASRATLSDCRLSHLNPVRLALLFAQMCRLRAVHVTESASSAAVLQCLLAPDGAPRSLIALVIDEFPLSLDARDALVSTFSAFRNLKELSVLKGSGWQDTTPTQFTALPSMPDLAVLRWPELVLNERELVALTVACPRLRVLSVTVDDVCFDRIRLWANCASLTLSFRGQTSLRLDWLKQLPNLRCLGVQAPALEWEQHVKPATCMVHLPCLHHLHLFGEFGPRSLGPLQLPELRSLLAREVQLPLAATVSMAPALERLYMVASVQIIEALGQPLADGSLPWQRLTQLHLRVTPTTNASDLHASLSRLASKRPFLAVFGVPEWTTQSC
jgi:hypothetical protein